MSRGHTVVSKELFVLRDRVTGCHCARCLSLAALGLRSMTPFWTAFWTAFTLGCFWLHVLVGAVGTGQWVQPSRISQLPCWLGRGRGTAGRLWGLSAAECCEALPAVTVCVLANRWRRGSLRRDHCE